MGDQMGGDVVRQMSFGRAARLRVAHVARTQPGGRSLTLSSGLRGRMALLSGVRPLGVAAPNPGRGARSCRGRSPRDLLSGVRPLGAEATSLSSPRRLFTSMAAASRSWRSMVLIWVCGLVCVLSGGVASASATQFGSQGTRAGQFEGSSGVAIDQGTGDVYVADQYNHRIDKFDGSGAFLFAWGWGVNKSSPADELQTCTASTLCQRGYEGAGAGQFAGEGPQSVAVDNNEPLSDLSAGDVYVEDFEGFRVEKFDAEGKFLTAFGSRGTGNGQFEWAFDANGILAVGPEGDVYVGDKARVEVFEASGAWKESISLAGLSVEGKVTSLAVNAAGDVFVKDEGVASVREFAPGGAEMPAKFDEGSETVEAMALDAAGDLFVADSAGGFHVLKFNPAGAELDSFASKAATGTRGIAYSDGLGQLYVANIAPSEVVIVDAPTSAGPWIEAGSEAAKPGLRGAATFEANVNPEGNDTSYHFEYVDEASFQASGFTHASSTPSTPIGSATGDFEDHAAEASLPEKTLVPGVTYHWRLVLTDTTGHTVDSSGHSFEEVPAAYVDGPWAADVASTSATLAAQINPLGANTEYRLEWGSSPAYEHVYTGDVGDGMEFVQVGGFHVQGLAPDTTYHYRLVTISQVGTIESADHTFTTQIGGQEMVLPDGRAWELVSPADKKGALVEPLYNYRLIRASADGSAISYQASDAIGEGATGKENVNIVISSRNATGWRTSDITRPHNLPPEGRPAVYEDMGTADTMLSSNLTLGITEQGEGVVRPLSSQATEKTPYLRNNLICEAQPEACYTPLLTSANATVPFGGFTPEGAVVPALGSEAHVVGATPDLHHLILSSPYALTVGEGAVSGAEEVQVLPQNLYEWTAGKLQLVNVLPDGKSRPGAFLGYQASVIGSPLSVAHAISHEGRVVVWSYGAVGEENVELFVRDMAARKTIKLGGVNANYQTMSRDGSRVFYRENGELYEVNVETGAQVDITAGHGTGEKSAGVQDALLGASEDGSYLYFVATGVLASGATPGAYNLYVMHDAGGGWSTTYITTLSLEDEKSWYSDRDFEEFRPPFDNRHPCNCHGNEGFRVTSQVSTNGRFVSFMSSRSLTGYDNVDAVSGQPDEEVYLYDAVANRLICASCNPSGARPVGVLDGIRGLLVDPEKETWGTIGEEPGETEGEHWLAGVTPGPEDMFMGLQSGASYQARFLTSAGRLFFESPDGLVPQATNGLMNVYEYEPVGVGGCETSSSTYSEGKGGCVSLISAGTSSGESAFYDASESGNDVFFITSDKLVPADYDTSYDVYDAHVCSVSVPCHPILTSPPPCTSGDSCKAAPTPQPEIFGPAPSATFSGVGNLTRSSSRPGVKHHSLSRAQKLRRALRACRKKKGRAKRKLCERRAHRRYGARSNAKKSGRSK